MTPAGREPIRTDWSGIAGRWVLLAAAALALNAAWEYAQLPLYQGGPGLPSSIMVRAIATDGVLVLGAAVPGALLVAWTRRPWPGWCVLIGALAATAVFIEVRAVTAGRWAYTAAMPTIGIVGLSPLLQLPTTGTLAVLVAGSWERLVGPPRRGG